MVKGAAARPRLKEAMVFDLRTEAEMRLFSEKTARELALKKRREEGVESEESTTAETSTAVAVEPVC
ncbi:hypothetical protein [Streptomyces caeruleatus]|uniref:hypothetical protein n=1 Tax=Streptomyces caeruleatus TaxID=661399 RepID=UPI00131DA218|nr:hypothetical protein [Streptomyces caeruleatus]